MKISIIDSLSAICILPTFAPAILKITVYTMRFNDDLRDWMQASFDELVSRLDRIEKFLDNVEMKQKLLDGERLLDNQDVCQKLNVSKRTLQRYRSSGELPYKMIYHKTFYKESDVDAFIKTNFNKRDKPDDDAPEETPEETDDN